MIKQHLHHFCGRSRGPIQGLFLSNEPNHQASVCLNTLLKKQDQEPKLDTSEARSPESSPRWNHTQGEPSSMHWWVWHRRRALHGEARDKLQGGTGRGQQPGTSPADTTQSSSQKRWAWGGPAATWVAWARCSSWPVFSRFVDTAHQHRADLHFWLNKPKMRSYGCADFWKNVGYGKPCRMMKQSSFSAF
jgi:hypothetical protein